MSNIHGQIKLAWSVLARGSSIDQDSGTVSVFNIIERLNLDRDQIEAGQKQKDQSHILIPFSFELISLWWRQSSQDRLEVQLRLGLVDPAEKVLFSKEYPLVFEAGKDRVRVRAKLNEFKIGPAGIYRFRIYVKQPDQDRFEVAGDLPLEVVLADLKPKG